MKRAIAKIRGGGMFLELWDRSKWAIRPIDATLTCCWSPGEIVEISQPIPDRSFNYEIENVDLEQKISVFALRVK